MTQTHCLQGKDLGSWRSDDDSRTICPDRTTLILTWYKWARCWWIGDEEPEEAGREVKERWIWVFVGMTFPNKTRSAVVTCVVAFCDQIYYWRSGPVERLNKDEQKMNNFVKYVISLQTNLIGGGLRLSELHARNCQCLDVTLLRTPFGCWCWLSHVTIVESSHLDMFCFCSLRCTQLETKPFFTTQNITQKHCVYKALCTSSTICRVNEYTSLKIESRECVQTCLASLLLELVAERKGSFACWSMSKNMSLRAIWQFPHTPS
jgi:hypothetical protein